MSLKTPQEIHEILKNARHEYSYNYSLDFNRPDLAPESAPAFPEYWKFSDVLKAFDNPTSINWQTIETIISSQAPTEIKQYLPYGWTRNHLKNFNYYTLKDDKKPIEISRYTGWAIANQLQNTFSDSAFQKAYFMNPSASEQELLENAKIINYTTERAEISKTVTKINGIIGSLAEKYFINHSQISRDFWRSIYIKLFGQNYNFNQKLAKKRGYLDYMDYRLLKILNIRLNQLINEWDTSTPTKNQTPNHFVDMTNKYMARVQMVLQRAPITLISDKKLTPIAINFAKQEQNFIQQFIKSKQK